MVTGEEVVESSEEAVVLKDGKNSRDAYRGDEGRLLCRDLLAARVDT